MGTQLSNEGTTSDTISRQAAIELLWQRMKNARMFEEWTVVQELERLRHDLDDLPSPEPRKGKWIKDECGSVICSECKAYRRDSRINHIRFCNACGADMRGEQDE